MRYDSVQQQKGLFTFYKQQQADEDQIRRILKKRKKGKAKKQKKHLQIIRQDASLSPTLNKDISLTQMGQSKDSNSCSRFLKNVISKQNSQLNMSHHDKALSSFCIKTQQAQRSHDKEEEAKFFVQRNPELHKSSMINLAKQKQKKNDQIGQSHYKIQSLHNKIQALQQKIKLQEVSKTKQEQATIEQKQQSRSFLQKLKFLQLSNKSNLISNKNSIYVNDKEANNLHQENRKYFHQLISNFYKRADEKNQTGYKMIKETLKFPHIIKAEKTLRMKTEEESPIEIKQKLVTPIKVFPHNRKDLKRKPSNQKRKKIKLKDQQKQQNSEDGKKLNFIDLSKDYSKQHIESEDRVIKKKMVKCRLGLQL